MDVFIIISPRDDVGGCALVAARNIDEAYDTFCKNEKYKVQYEEYECLTYQYKGLYLDTNIPTVILNHLVMC